MSSIPKYTTKNALLSANVYAKLHGGKVYRTLGTGSMKPLLDAPAYVVCQDVPFDGVQLKDVLVYNGRLDPSKPDRKVLIHRAVLKDKYGWLMSGDNNKRSESWDRVTKDTLLGRCVVIFQDEANPAGGDNMAAAQAPDR